MCCEPVENVGRNRIASDEPGHKNQHGYRDGVEQDDEHTVHQGAEAVLRRLVIPLHKETYRHRDDREYARRQQGREAPEYGGKNHTPYGSVRSFARRGGILLRRPQADGKALVIERSAVVLVAGHPFNGQPDFPASPDLL